jgi:hypothetical protein
MRRSVQEMVPRRRRAGVIGVIGVTIIAGNINMSK